MNYLNFIDYLINPEKLDILLNDLNVDTESEVLIVCFKDSIDINSEIAIFAIEETDGDLIFERDGNKYIELFPLDALQEMVEEYVNTYKNISNNEIGQRVIDYRLNDA